jgi:hypothetical protein
MLALDSARKILTPTPTSHSIIPVRHGWWGGVRVQEQGSLAIGRSAALRRQGGTGRDKKAPSSPSAGWPGGHFHFSKTKFCLDLGSDVHSANWHFSLAGWQIYLDAPVRFACLRCALGASCQEGSGRRGEVTSPLPGCPGSGKSYRCIVAFVALQCRAIGLGATMQRRAPAAAHHPVAGPPAPAQAQ